MTWLTARPLGLTEHQIGQGLDRALEQLHLGALGTLLPCLLVVAAAALLARRAVGAAPHPVASMTAQAAQWSERDLDRASTSARRATS